MHGYLIYKYLCIICNDRGDEEYMIDNGISLVKMEDVRIFSHAKYNKRVEHADIIDCRASGEEDVALYVYDLKQYVLIYT